MSKKQQERHKFEQKANTYNLFAKLWKKVAENYSPADLTTAF